MKYTNTPRSRVARYCLEFVLTALLLLFAASVANSKSTVVITSIDGEAIQGEGRLSIHDEVEPNELLETGDGTSCSLLLAEGAVLQACNGAAIRLVERGPGESQIVELKAGELKASVGARPADDPFEIHTPAAIATILGTTLHVRVDPETGDTTITSLSNRIRVESSDPAVEGFVTLEAGEEVTIRKGEAPNPKRRVDISAMAAVSDCIDDARFHRAAVGADRESREAEVLDAITAVDIPLALPPVSSPSGGGGDVLSEAAGTSQAVVGTGGAIDEGTGVCQATSCFLVELPPLPMLPAPCAGAPGEQCSF
jgi:hypothetical protein